MIIEKIVPKKNLAATLALALGVSLPAGAQMISGRAASFAPSPMVFAAPALSLNAVDAPSGFTPITALAAPGVFMPAAAAATPARSAAAPLAAPPVAAAPLAARTADIEAAKTALASGEPGSAASRAALDAAFEGSPARDAATAGPEGAQDGLPVAELAAKASGFIAASDLPASRVFLGARAVMDGGRAVQWKFSFSAHRDRADRFKNERTTVDVVVSPSGELIAMSTARSKAGFFSSRKADGMKSPQGDPKAALAQAALEYPDMAVETISYAEETDESYLPSAMPFSNPEGEWVYADVPVWRLEGRSKENPGVRMSASYDAKSGLLRDEKTKIETAAKADPRELPGDTPVWANLWFSFDAPYPTPQRVIDAGRDRVVRRFGVERWTELKTEPKMFGYKVYRLRMTAAQYVKLREADTGAHFEYAGTAAR